jgi:uncharacterized protein (DUF58 family)
MLFDADFLSRLERLHLIAKRLDWAGAGGEHAASRKGYSLEFSDYRRYHRGDDLRYVDWNIYRRLDRLVLKVFTAEEELNIYLLIDTSASMAVNGDRPRFSSVAEAEKRGLSPVSKLDYAKKVAAALGYIGLKNLDRVGGAGFSSALQTPLRLGRGRTQILRMFGFLERLPCAGATNLASAIHRFTMLFPQPGLAIVVSDLFDPAGWRAAIEELARNVVGDVALVDAEGQGERRLFVDAELARRFEEELALYFRDIESACRNVGVDYLRTTTRVPFDDFILKSLRQLGAVS